MNLKKTLLLFIIVSFFNAFYSQVSADCQKNKNFKDFKASSIGSYSAAVIDASTGELIFGKRENEKRSLASITKILGAYTYLNESPNLDKKTTLISADEMGGSRLRLKIGTSLKAKDLLYSSLMGSANNAATSLIRLSGLSKNKFVEKMESLADAAEASSKTNFVDACGISPENTTTAKDISLIGKKVFENELIEKISSKKSYSFYINNKKGQKTIIHTSPIVTGKNSDFSVLAAKTGYLPEAGYNLITKAKPKKGKGEVIVVTLGAKSQSGSTRDNRKLISWALQNYKWK